MQTFIVIVYNFSNNCSNKDVIQQSENVIQQSEKFKTWTVIGKYRTTTTTTVLYVCMYVCMLPGGHFLFILNTTNTITQQDLIWNVAMEPLDCLHAHKRVRRLNTKANTNTATTAASIQNPKT